MHIFGEHHDKSISNIFIILNSKISFLKLCINTICTSWTLPLRIPSSRQCRNLSLVDENIFSRFVFGALLVFPILDQYMCRRSCSWSSMDWIHKQNERRMAATNSFCKFYLNCMPHHYLLSFQNTVLVNANVGFLAIQSIDNSSDSPGRSPAQIASFLSVIASSGSIVLGLIHVRKHRGKARDTAADVVCCIAWRSVLCCAYFSH